MRQLACAFIAVLFLLGMKSNSVLAQCAPGSPQVDNFATTGAAAPALRSTAVGINALANCENSIAIGFGAVANGPPGGSTAIGVLSSVTAVGSVAVGGSSAVTGREAVALGNAAQVNGARGIALGVNAQANHDDSIAIGYGVVTSAPNQIALGGSSATYRLQGLSAVASGIRFVTVDANGNLSASASAPGGAVPIVNDVTTGGTASALAAEQGVVLNSRISDNSTAISTNASNISTNRTGIAQNSNAIATNTQNIATNSANIAANRSDIRSLENVTTELREDVSKNSEGVAIALATQSIDFVGAENFGIAMNYGNFEGASALSVSLAGVISNDFAGSGARMTVNGGVGMGLDSGTVGLRAGTQWTW